MTFALSYHANVPALLTQPRLFIGPEVPGYLSTQGTILLPLTLDGHMTDTGIRPDERGRLERYLFDRKDGFVCDAPVFRIRSDRESYERAVHPSWLADVRGLIDDDWERYAAVLADHPLQKIALHSVKSGLQALHPIFSGCLYLGSYGLEHAEQVLYPHDLSLYAQPVDARGPLFPILRLLETFYLTREQIRSGVAEKVTVQRVEEEEPSVHDIALDETHGPLMEFALPGGAVIGLLRDDIRPTMLAIPNRLGNINPVALEGPSTHPVYMQLQHELLHRASLFLGFVLILHYQLDGPLLEAFIRRLEGIGRIDPWPTPEHLQFVLESEMYELGNNLSRDDQGFEGRCLLRAIQALRTIA
jgi:hypothetical protein